MGHILYDAQARTRLDDRTLAHLQVVITTKLRRDEGFAFSWKNPMKDGDGRRTIWIAPQIPLQFVFDSSTVPTINTAWVDALMLSANAASGLHLTPEPEKTT